ncbi:MAG: adenosylcobinamide-GDP ribazoletransferase [Halobacteriota archaeon]
MTALAGALGFLTTIPLQVTDDAWEGFRHEPAVVPAIGYLVGALVAIPVVVSPAPALGGFAFVLAVYVLTGINHFDGLTDLADGLAVHGSEAERVGAMRDSALGVGGLLAGAIVVLGLFAVGQVLTGRGRGAIGIIVAAEVAAKLAMLVVLVRGTPRHEGLGSSLAEFATHRSLAVGGLLAVPAMVLSWPSPASGVALAGGLIVALVVGRVARSRLGGISGDVVGATNEVARLTGLLLGVIAWTLW